MGVQRHGRPTGKTEDPARALAPTVRHAIVLRRTGQPVPWTPGRDLEWAEVVSAREPSLETEELDAEAPSMVLYTSGTTGKPKGCVHTHAGVLAQCVGGHGLVLVDLACPSAEVLRHFSLTLAVAGLET